jgi:hypothetical protein
MREKRNWPENIFWRGTKSVKGLVLLSLALPLAGCMENQERQLAACKLESMRLYEEPQIIDAFHALPYNKYIVTCMAAKGYGMAVRNKKCVTGINFAVQVDCYTPPGWLERNILELEERLNPD